MPTLATLKEQAVMSMLKLLNNYEPAHLFLPGTLGNAVGVVDVPGRTGYVYVRLLGDATRTIRARNMGITAVADATVWVENVGSPGDRERYRIPLTDNTGSVSDLGNVRSLDDISVDNAVTRFHGTTGRVIQSSTMIVDDSGNAIVNGYLIANKALTSKTSDYTATATDEVIVVDATSNTVTITLPTAVGITGRCYMVKCVDDTYTVTVVGDEVETIDGELTQTINQWENIQVISDGSNWLII